MNSLKEIFHSVSPPIQMSKQNRRLYHHDEEQLGFYKRVHMKT